MVFNPNRRTLAEGIKTVQDAIRQAKVQTDKIITSQDPEVKKAVQILATDNVPSGFNKWQLPVHVQGETLCYLSFGSPNAEVPEHSHDEGGGLRVIISGSMIYKGTELRSGDWMLLPKGAKYSFKVGPMGVGIFYCYQCCCA